MPLPLTDAELAMLHALAAPIDAALRPEFMGGGGERARGDKPGGDRAGHCAPDCAHRHSKLLDRAARSPSGPARSSRAPNSMTGRAKLTRTMRRVPKTIAG
jgi:hypothetical protein